MKKKINSVMAEFENMLNMAEIRALSTASLERPLSDNEFSRMMKLYQKVNQWPQGSCKSA